MKSILSYFFNILKVKDNKIVFSNFNGNGYGCNPKYVTEELIHQKKAYDIVWLTKDNATEFPKEIRVVKWGSLRAIYEWATAKIIVNNVRMGGYFAKGYKKKNGQIYIQTWHGSSGIKKIERDNKKLDEKYTKKAKIDSENIDYLVSCSKWLTTIYRQAFYYNGRILEIGNPRNDIFFQSNTFKGKKQRKIALVAPTFGNMNSVKENINKENVTKLLEALASKLGGEWEFWLRLHPKERKGNNFDSKFKVVCDEPDMQKILTQTDVLITDFSSAAFDFVLTKKPIFIYTFGIQRNDYKDLIYYDFKETPFSVAEEFNDLLLNVYAFNKDDYEKKCIKFINSKGSFDDGKASKRLVNVINMHVEENDTKKV